MKTRFMNLEDKTIISKDQVYPPHCLFHKLPFTKPVTVMFA